MRKIGLAVALAAFSAFGAEERISLPQGHLRVVAYELVDRTDDHNELVHRREWLAGGNERSTDVTAPILAYESPLTGEGAAFVRVAPLPHARANPSAADFNFDLRARRLVVRDTGYPCVRLPYRGGAAGRTKALQDWQRTVRPYVSGRDGLFLSNTWGDRNRDTRINEAFLLGEVKASAELGVEVVQVDDGWQSGRTMNSAFANGKGVWNGYWAASPDFWVPDPKRFPRGLAFVTKAAAAKGIRFGLWFGPDSSNDAANWERDADWLLKLYRECGVDYYKFDTMKTTGAESLARQKKLFDKVLKESGGRIVIDLDVTAEKRLGYFGVMTAGPIFVENRYTDWKTYWPHLTLRALWSLCEVMDPIRLRMEVLNPLRSRGKYGDDPLAPAAYPAETLFAIVMPASPLGWFEVQNLAPETVAAWKPLVGEVEGRARRDGGVQRHSDRLASGRGFLDRIRLRAARGREARVRASLPGTEREREFRPRVRVPRAGASRGPGRAGFRDGESRDRRPQTRLYLAEIRPQFMIKYAV